MSLRSELFSHFRGGNRLASRFPLFDFRFSQWFVFTNRNVSLRRKFTARYEVIFLVL